MPPDGFEVLPIVAKLLNKLSVSQLAKLSKLSKSYISQVKHGKRPPSQKLIQAIEHLYGEKRKRNGFSIDKAHCVRDKAIVSLFTESGLRLSELLHIKTRDIDWKSHTIKVLGKGNKEGYAPFGILTEQYLRLWLSEYKPKPNQRIWNIATWGIQTMLDELKQETGLPCNPHTFRRTFACLLRKQGVKVRD